MRPGSPCLFDHVALPVRDIARSRAFYERALQPFGVRVVENPSGPGFALGGQDFWIGERDVAAGSVHIAFAAPDRETVDASHAAAVEAGGQRHEARPPAGFTVSGERSSKMPETLPPSGLQWPLPGGARLAAVERV